MSQGGSLNMTGGKEAMTSLTGNDGVLVAPVGHNINLVGATVANGTDPLPVYVKSGGAGIEDIDVQLSTASASSEANNAGLASFSNTQFSVDANGFVTINGAGVAETITGDTGGALSPSSGNWIIYANNTGDNCGSSVLFSGSGHTLTLNVTDSNNNSLIGKSAGNSTLSGTSNTSLGYNALNALTIGDDNVAIGNGSMVANLQGSSNVAVGVGSLATNTNGAFSVAIGTSALALANTGTNTAIGYASSANLTSGTNNTSVGCSSLNSCVTGGANVVVGYQSGLAMTGGANTAIGSQCLYNLTSGQYNTCIGYTAGSSYTTNEQNNICIGFQQGGTTAESNVTRIGNSSTADCYIFGIDGVNVASTANVVTEHNNQLGTAVITGGTGVTITSTANEIIINASSSGFSWNNVTGGSSTLVAENGYFANSASLTTFTLPSILSSNFGDTIKIVGFGTGGWKIAQLALEQIVVGNATSTAGIGGSVASTGQYDTIELVYSPTSGLWQAIYWTGNLTVT